MQQRTHFAPEFLFSHVDKPDETVEELKLTTSSVNGSDFSEAKQLRQEQVNYLADAHPHIGPISSNTRFPSTSVPLRKSATHTQRQKDFLQIID